MSPYHRSKIWIVILSVVFYLVSPCLAEESRSTKSPGNRPVTDLSLLLSVEERDPFDPPSDFNPQSPFYDRFNPPDPSVKRSADAFVLIKSAADEYRFLRWLGASIRNSEEVLDEYATRFRLKGNIVLAEDSEQGLRTRKEIQVGGDIKTAASNRRRSSDSRFRWLPDSFSWNLGMDMTTAKITSRFDIGKVFCIEAAMGSDTRVNALIEFPF